jgi:hypothetical protein
LPDPRGVPVFKAGSAGELIMLRKFGITALVLCAAVGCHMCASPYDYCGPVIENGGPPSQGCATCGGGMNGDYGAARQNYGQQQNGFASSQSGGQQGPSLSSNSTSMMR